MGTAKLALEVSWTLPTKTKEEIFHLPSAMLCTNKDESVMLHNEMTQMFFSS